MQPALDPVSDLPHRLAAALGLTPTVSSPAPFTILGEGPDGATCGILLSGRSDITTACMEALETACSSGQAAQIAIVVTDGVDDALRDLVEGFGSCFPSAVASVDDVLARATKQKRRITAFGTAAADGIGGALAEVRRRILNLSTSNQLLSFRPTRLSIAFVRELLAQVVDQLVVRQRPMVIDPLPEEEVAALGDEEGVEEETSDIQAAFQAHRTGLEDTESSVPSVSQPGLRKTWTDDRLQAGLPYDRLEPRLRLIAREYDDRIQGRGLNELYLAVGMLSWFEDVHAEKERRAPLVVVPITMVRERVDEEQEIKRGDPDYTRPNQTRTVIRYRYTLRHSGEALRGNPTLALKLEQDFAIALPDLDRFREEDGSGIDIKAYLAAVDASIKTRSEDPRWRVRRDLVLGFFTYAKAVMEEDLDLTRWSGPIPGKELLKSVLLGSQPIDELTISEAEVEAAQSTPELACIDDCDGSQAKAVLLADRGRDLVIQGPPGTGKSQTITNLIAQALSRGKRVLFVSEKLAALDVVRTRLVKRGLGDFLLPLHDTKLGVKSLHEVLVSRLNRRKHVGNQFVREIERLAQDRVALGDWAATMARKERGSGLTVHEILWEAIHLRSEVEVRMPPVGSVAAQALASCRLERAATTMLVNIADEIFADLRLHEADGILDRCRCWTGFLVRPLLPGDRETVAAELTLFLAILRDGRGLLSSMARLGWPEEPTPWAQVMTLGDDSARRLEELPAHDPAAAPAISLLADPDPIRAALPTEVLALLGERDRLGSAISDALGAEPPQRWAEHALAAEAQATEASIRAEATITVVRDLLDRLNDERQSLGLVEQAMALMADQLGLSKPETVEEWLRLTKLVGVLLAAPVGITDALRPEHVAPGFEQAVIEARTANDRHDAAHALIAKIVVPEDLPEVPELVELRQILRQGTGTLAAWLPWSGFSRARRRCRRFLRDPHDVKRRLPAVLEAMAEWPKFRERITAFKEDRVLCQRIGSLFTGVTSDWTRLNALRGLVSQLAENCARNRLTQVADRLPLVLADRTTLTEQHQVLLDGCARLQRLRDDVGRVLRPTPEDKQGNAIVGTWLAGVTQRLVSSDLVRLLGELPGLPAKVAWKPCLDAIAAIRRLTAVRIRLRDPELAGAFGPTFGRESQDPAPLKAAIVFRDLVCALPEPVAAWLRSTGGGLLQVLPDIKAACATATSLRQRWQASTERLTKLRQKDVLWPTTGSATIDEISSTLAMCLSRIDDLPGWSRIVALRERSLAEPALANLVDAVLVDRANLPVDVAHTAWKSARFDALAQGVFTAIPELARFDRARHENRRTAFMAGDRTLADSAVEHVANRLLDVKAPSGHGTGPVREWTELSLINRELGKKMRHIPVRDLVHRSGHALQALMPCWMMSPLSVSWFLPRGGMEFDLVVMDEASQIRPEDAIGALMRSKQAIIVGDSQQMPPSRAFDAGASSLEGLFAVSGMESILGLAESCKRFQRTRLTWHYRSQHESLIAFSNQRYYDGDLLVFPSIHRLSSNLGIQWAYVEDAAYATQRNQREAEVVVEHILTHARKLRHLPEAEQETLGVAAMNAPQRDLISDMLERRRETDPEADAALRHFDRLDERLFIQNLENVQGDERDHIIISFTYGPDAASRRVMQRFGPILQSGGERRLNVLFTRARRRVTVVSSLRSNDVIAGPGSARGLRDLKAYLAYAENRTVLEPGEVDSAAEHDSPFEAEVARVLGRLGYRWQAQVGVAGYFIDLGVYHPDHPETFLLGIECDGASYHSSRIARDRDRLREEVLRARGWRLHRIWSTDWFSNKGLESARLEEAIRRAVQ